MPMHICNVEILEGKREEEERGGEIRKRKGRLEKE